MIGKELEPGSETTIKTVGEEFVEWAEQGWALKHKYDTSEDGSESCDYEYIRNIFINKIDNIIINRLLKN